MMISSSLLQSVDSTGTVVEKEDQGRINQFANQVARRNELRDDIETQEVGISFIYNKLC